MNLIERLKNLWKWSNYEPNILAPTNENDMLRKTIPTIEKKQAIIIKEPINFFENDTTGQ